MHFFPLDRPRIAQINFLFFLPDCECQTNGQIYDAWYVTYKVPVRTVFDFESRATRLDEKGAQSVLTSVPSEVLSSGGQWSLINLIKYSWHRETALMRKFPFRNMYHDFPRFPTKTSTHQMGPSISRHFHGYQFRRRNVFFSGEKCGRNAKLSSRLSII